MPLPSLLLLLLAPVVAGARFPQRVRPACAPDAAECVFYLTLEHRWSMVKYTPEYAGPVVVTDELRQVRDRSDCSLEPPLNDTELLSDVILGDGSYKLLTVYNHSLPGPPIVVYEGQQVVVHLTNQLIEQATTMHFHGVHQRGTPWMDGAGGVSHCPINPGETFTYRFQADETGTHWYHSHYGTQRSMGAYGPLVVLDRGEDENAHRKYDAVLPPTTGAFHLVVSDYFLRPSHEISLLVKDESVTFASGWDSDTCYHSTKQPDGYDCGVIPFHSAVINGIGQHYPNRSDDRHVSLPYETFHVTRHGGRYRFRTVCASLSFGFRLSVDGHNLTLVAVDGKEVIRRKVESAMVLPGERLDFYIDATDPDNAGAYWIRADTLEYYQNQKRILPGKVLAVLQYDDASSTQQPAAEPPTTQRQPCTQDRPCQVFNCPFKAFAPSFNLTCVHLTELQAAYDYEAPSYPNKDRPFHEHFLNFHFAHDGFVWRSTINGIQHVHPAAPPQLFPPASAQRLSPCASAGPADATPAAHRRCTHELAVPLGAVVQLVLVITTNNPEGVTNGNSHQIHLHGQHVQVVSVGHGTYSAEEGIFQDNSADFRCLDAACNSVVWVSDQKRQEVLNYQPNDSIWKDTVVVPVGGYVVVRFIADNPGYWYMHCHTEFHNEEGMALYLKVGDESDMPRPPANMSTCGNFDWSSEQFTRAINHMEEVRREGVHRFDLFQVLSMVLAATTMSACMLCVVIYVHLSAKHQRLLQLLYSHRDNDADAGGATVMYDAAAQQGGSISTTGSSTPRAFPSEAAVATGASEDDDPTRALLEKVEHNTYSM